MTQPKFDLTNCDQEPITVPNLIQPHGVLIVLNDDLIVQQVSANAGGYLGVEAEQCLGKNLGTIIDASVVQTIQRWAGRLPSQWTPVYLASVKAVQTEQVLDAIVHRIGGGELIVLELEPAHRRADAERFDIYPQVQIALTAVRAAQTVADLCRIVAEQVRSINGFDRVMVYRFDSEWNGEVIAEDKRNDLEPFLGLHYPASDIPVQARQLYTKNWLRFIPNRDYTPSPMMPAKSPITNDLLDMSFCVLRSVSPIHIEYLRNMGVWASMSISLILDGKLWGLVACHHYSRRLVPFEVRTASEHLGQVMSLMLAAREHSDTAQDAADKRRKIDQLVARVDPTQKFPNALLDDRTGLLSLVSCGGAAIVNGHEVQRIGQTPSEQDILDIVSAIRKAGDREVFDTEYVQDLVGHGRLANVAAGLLAVSLTRFGQRYLIWFRPEQLRQVNWAGDPNKSVVKGDEGVRLSPRGSFALWRQTVHGRSFPWSNSERRVAIELRQALAAKLLAHSEELVSRNLELHASGHEKDSVIESERAARLQAERVGRLKDEFVATLSHELRTPLNAIQGWTQLLRRGSRSPEDVEEALEVIERNARIQTQMVEELLDMSRITSGKLKLNVQPVELPAVLDAAIATVKVAADNKNIRIHKMVDELGDTTVTGDPDRLQQIFWNLLSNAVKFTPKNGEVKVAVRRVESHVEMSVIDTGIGIKPEFLPHVFERFRQENASTNRQHGGLGLGLAIVRHLVELQGGTVSADSAGEYMGATFTVTLPIRAVAPRHHFIDQDEEPSVDAPIEVDLAGRKILVLDDEPDAREMVKRVLVECHADVISAGSAREALDLLAHEPFDVVVSDIGMPEMDGYQFIKKVRELEAKRQSHKTPVVALTAYARAEDRRKILISGFQAHVSKPVDAGDLVVVVASQLERD
jgi:chemotaxis family two-component system sensor kinase Cph1